MFLGYSVERYESKCFFFKSTLKTVLLNLACIFAFEGSSGTDQPLPVNSSQSLCHGAYAAPEEPIGATSLSEGERGITHDFSQGGNQRKKVENRLNSIIHNADTKLISRVYSCIHVYVRSNSLTS